ncbi:MAG TPA: hypothetical protein HA224_00485 [Nanoarchaeota archaeon]|nr:hypothetical protein [Nanoarchaeota archaeon]
MGLQFHKDNFTRQWDYKSFGNMGTSLNPGQANQLQQLNTMISSGQGGAEVITLQRNIWETIPIQHFDEMRRLSTLTGFEPTIHAPLIEPSGLTQGQGGGTTVSEELRRSEGRHLNVVLDRAVQLVDPKNPRNISVNVHPSTIPGPIYRIAQEDLKDSEGKVFKTKGKEYLDADFAIDPESGQIAPLKFEVKYYPPTKSGEKEHVKVWTPEERLDNMNVTSWENEVAQTFGATEFQEKQMRAIVEQAGEKGFTPQLQTLLNKLNRDAQSKMHELYNDVRIHSIFEEENWKKLPKEEQTRLAEDKEQYGKWKNDVTTESQKILKTMEEMRDKINKTENKDEQAALGAMSAQAMRNNNTAWADFFNKLAHERGKNDDYVFAPRKFIPLEEFSMERTSKTFAEAAVHALEEAGRKAKEKGLNPLDIVPMVNIENMPANMQAFGRADQLKRLVEETRIKTAGLLEGKYGRAEANKIAEKIVGATWDVGHINLLRTAGFGEKEIIEEAKKIAPLVKHFHITDNFGSSDSHLAPGQGNAIPTEQVKAIRDAALAAGKPLSASTKEIMEIGGFVEHQRVSPWPDTLTYMNSPIYETENQEKAWSDTGGDIGTSYFSGSSSYVAGYGNILPEQHFGMYGSGFTGLPILGGQMGGGDKSKFTGTPMS